MGHHGRWKRIPQLIDSATLPGTILPPDIQSTGLPAAPSSIAFASPETPLTTVASTFVQVTTVDGSIETSSFVSSIIITDSSAFAELTAAQASKTSSSSTSHATASNTSSATAAAQKSSSNLGTLVPAIVVPVVVVLLALFGLFWFCMRRRHRRELKNSEFVMAGKGEKLSSRSNSSRSGAEPSSFGLIDKKQPIPKKSEKQKLDANPWGNHSKPSMDEIGIARPLTSQDSRPSTSNGPNSRWGSNGTAGTRTYTNFNEPRPSTARQPPRSRNDPPEGRTRSNSSPSRQRPPGASHGRDYGRDHRGKSPSPIPQSGPYFNFPSYPDSAMLSQRRDVPSKPRIHDTPKEPPKVRLRVPSPTMGSNTRANPPPPVRLPPPGAFNGASPISQYSPIVKDMPSIAASTTPVETSNKRAIPPPIHITKAETKKSQSERSSDSNGQDHGLTEENMRIARLANSSRLGFADPAPSPKLPPPATRSQLIPHESPGQEREQYFTNSHSRSGSQRDHDHDLDHEHNLDHDHHNIDHNIERNHFSDDSDISEGDDYEDMDVRSDVSSLNEIEREAFSRRHTGNSTGGRRSARHSTRRSTRHTSRNGYENGGGGDVGNPVPSVMRNIKLDGRPI